MRSARKGNAERGAALIIVLLLVATLSFILLSITNIVSGSVQRSASDRARTDSYWRAAAGEVIASKILERYLESNPAKMAPETGIFGKALEVPVAGGKATVDFRDATVCFNVNSLVAGEPGNYAEAPANIENFVLLMETIGVGGGEARKLADVIVDFIDADDLSRGQGAEDGFYTALPTPYRTGRQLIQSLSELRAMDGVSAALFDRVRPFLCALDSVRPAPVNINMIQPAGAPVLLALLGPASDASLGELQAQIAAIPPGGIETADALPPPLKDAPIAFVSARIEAVIRLEVNDQTIEEKLLFDAKPGSPPKLLARTFGDDL